MKRGTASLLRGRAGGRPVGGDLPPQEGRAPFELVHAVHAVLENPAHAATRSDLERRLAALLAAHGLTAATDKMPLDEGIQSALPDTKIR